jgi:hypothetical protein
MTTEEARAILHDPEARHPAVYEATVTVARDTGATVEDLCICLDHGGLAAEIAAITLYRRAHRPIPAGSTMISLTRAEWEDYLENAAAKAH